MARKLREEAEGAVHHVFSRGNRSVAIFVDDGDRRRYLRLLARTVRQQGWNCLSYCLMTTHMHLLIETPFPNLGAGMQRLHGDYALVFNRRHGHAGHLFQGRYGAVRVTTDEQLVTVARYIAANPVKAGLCEREHEWPWSSTAGLRGGSGPAWLASGRLLELAGATT
jgi:putative transposase